MSEAASRLPRVDLQQHLAAETVAQLQPAPPVCVPPQATVRHVLMQLRQNRRGAVLVCREGILVGIFTERDALRLMANGGDLESPIERIMTPNPVTLSPSDNVATAIAKMSQGGYRRLPIVDAQGRPQGVVKVSGILHYLVEHFPEAIYTLPPQPNAGTQEREGA